MADYYKGGKGNIATPATDLAAKSNFKRASSLSNVNHNDRTGSGMAKSAGDSTIETPATDALKLSNTHNVTNLDKV